MKRRRYSNPLSRVGTDFEVIVLLAGLGIAGYVLYKLYQGAKAVGQGAAAAAGAVADAGVAVYHGAQTVTSPLSTGIAKLVTLFDAPGWGSVPGNVLFPDGLAAPLSSYKVKTDASGNVYVVDRGSTYQLGQSDADGDWPATYVSG